MNVPTLLGFFGGWGVLITAIVFICNENNMPITSFIDRTGLVIVVAGMVMATLLKASMSEIKNLFSIMGQSFVGVIEPPTSIIGKIVDLATIARKDGIIALESQEISNPFMATAIRLLVDGAQPHVVKQTLSSELVSMKLRHKHGISVIAYMGEVAPAMGMVGTLVGLVALLANMEDVATLGTNMSVAVLTTLYGAFLANAVFLPIANKLGVQSDLESLNREIIIQGVQFIQAGGNPRVLEDQLNAYVAPRARNTVTA